MAERRLSVRAIYHPNGSRQRLFFINMNSILSSHRIYGFHASHLTKMAVSHLLHPSTVPPVLVRCQLMYFTTERSSVGSGCTSGSIHSFFGRTAFKGRTRISYSCVVTPRPCSPFWQKNQPFRFPVALRSLRTHRTIKVLDCSRRTLASSTEMSWAGPGASEAWPVWETCVLWRLEVIVTCHARTWESGHSVCAASANSLKPTQNGGCRAARVGR